MLLQQHVKMQMQMLLANALYVLVNISLVHSECACDVLYCLSKVVLHRDVQDWMCTFCSAVCACYQCCAWYVYEMARHSC
jgi:hypothetical protein